MIWQPSEELLPPAGRAAATYDLQHSSLHAKRAQLLGMTSLPAIYADVPLLPQSQSVLDVWQRPGCLQSGSRAIHPALRVLARDASALAVRARDDAGGGQGSCSRHAHARRQHKAHIRRSAAGAGAGPGKGTYPQRVRSEPFPRVDVQVQVDAEALVRAEVALSAAEEAINLAAVAVPTAQMASRTTTWWLRTRTSGIDFAWRALWREREWWHEAAGFDDAAGGGMPGRLVPLNSSVAVGATHRQAESPAAHAVAEAKDAWSNAGATVAAEDDAYSWAGLDDWFMDIAGAEAAEAEAEAERARVAALERRPPELTAALSEARDLGLSRPEELEIAIWVELDALLRSFATRNANLPPEEQRRRRGCRMGALALLPHRMPDSLGGRRQWPEGFQLYRMLELSSTFLGGEGGGGAGEEGARLASRRRTRHGGGLRGSAMHSPDVLPRWLVAKVTQSR